MILLLQLSGRLSHHIPVIMYSIEPPHISSTHFFFILSNVIVWIGIIIVPFPSTSMHTSEKRNGGVLMSYGYLKKLDTKSYLTNVAILCQQ